MTPTGAPSNQMGVMNTDLAKQLEAPHPGRAAVAPGPGPGQTTRHRHRGQHELYVVLDGDRADRVDERPTPPSRRSRRCSSSPKACARSSTTPIQTSLWLVAGAPPEAADALEMTPEPAAVVYTDGPKALPPGLGGGHRP